MPYTRSRRQFDVGKWLGVAIAVAGITTTLVFWQVLRRDQRAHVIRLTNLAARAVEADLAEDLNDRLDDLVRLAKYWELEHPPSDPEWKQIAGLFLHHLPGCLAVEYVDTAFRVSRELAVDNDQSDVGKQIATEPDLAAALNRGLNTRQPVVGLTTYSPSGAPGRRIAVPIYRGDRFRGFILAKFDTQHSLRDMLANDTGLGFSIMVSEAGKDLYQDPGSDSRLRAEWRQDAKLHLPGLNWSVSAWPNADLLPVLRSPLPEVALLLGLAVTSLLVATFYMGRSARAHAREIELVNEQLRTEIAERKIAEAARKESEERLAAVLEMSADAIVSADAARHIILFNRGAETIFGWKREQVIGKSLDLLMPSRFSEGHHKLMIDFSENKEQNLRRMGHSRTIPGVRRDGTEFPAEASISVLEFHGEKIYTAILRDVTERQVAQDALRRANDELEVRVMERTVELQRANAAMEIEVRERRQAEESLRQLSGRLLVMQDEERRRVARDLHDSTSQYLASLALSISAAQDLEPGLSADTRKILSDAFTLVERCSSEIRTMSYLLHPPLLDDLGLASALRWYAEGFSSRSNVITELEISPNLGRMPVDLERALFRIVQEALTNVRKHSGATRADIKLLRNGRDVSLEIRDNGHGFKVDLASAALGVGIAGMRERVHQLGGRLHIQSSSAGTLVEAMLPVQLSLAVAADGMTRSLHQTS